MVSFAAVYSDHRSSDARSIGDSFHCRTGSICRIKKRVRCSAGDTENQNLVSEKPSSSSSCLERRRLGQEQFVLLPACRSP